MNYLKERIGQVLNTIGGRIVTDTEKITGIEVCECGYKN